MNILHSLSIVFVILISNLSICQSFEITDSTLYAKAQRLAQEFFIVDTHIDLPIWLYGNWFDVSEQTDQGEFDYVRATKGGLNAAFMAIYTSPDLEGTGKSKVIADSLIEIVYRIEKEWPGKFKVIKSTEELTSNMNQGKVLLAMGMENGSPIDNNLDNLREFYDKGIRYITLAHYKWNHISDSGNDPERKWNGLSPFGEEVVKEMNRLGIIVDVSHLSDSAFYDIIRLSTAPVIASHSACRYFTPGYERNMSDEMIKVLADKGGVIQIYFASMFLVNDIYHQYVELEEAQEELDKFFKENNIDRGSPEGREYRKKLREEHQLGKASVKDVADHIDHVVNLVGADYVGIGSDFNGVGDVLPIGLKDVSDMPNLVYELLSRGYSDDDLRKILGGNLLRVWKEVEQKSQKN